MTTHTAFGYDQDPLEERAFTYHPSDKNMKRLKRAATAYIKMTQPDMSMEEAVAKVIDGVLEEDWQLRIYNSI